MQRILDLGCGTGDSWRSLAMPVEDCQVVGIDVRRDRLQAAREKYAARGWQYLCARGEDIPLSDASLDGVFCEVAMPYMHIPRHSEKFIACWSRVAG
jgi:ubiquinone/menaquinone biosynthesis C-methylase UbiE